MIIIKATLLNVYKSNDFTDKETGTVTHGKNKVQLLVQNPLKNGGVKNELLDISIPPEKLSLYEGKENEEVEVEVAFFGKVSFYGI